jgi:hypothetical protein
LEGARASMSQFQNFFSESSKELEEACKLIYRTSSVIVSLVFIIVGEAKFCFEHIFGIITFLYLHLGKLI